MPKRRTTLAPEVLPPEPPPPRRGAALVWRETEDFLDDEAAEERRRTKEERRALHAVILRVRMPAEDYNALLRLAMREGLAVSALARTVLRRFVADAKRRGPRRR